MWYCCRQRAGPLVKECRALRPRFAPEDTAEDRREKKLLKKYQRCAVNRKPSDRLELYLALFGHDGWMHTLTFDDDHLPHNFREVRRTLQAFFKRAQRWRAALDRPPGFKYIYAIEGLHGQRRYHVHLVSDYYELGPAEISLLWRCGFVDSEPVLQKTGGYRRLAEYLTKERTDGVLIPIGRHPFSASRSLTAALPAPKRWFDDSGEISVPADAICVRRSDYSNDFGAVHYASWLQFQSRTRVRELIT